MINFRYHVVSIIGIFIALAVGVVLGAGPLQSRIQAGVSSSASTSTADPLLSCWPLTPMRRLPASRRSPRRR